MQVVAAVDRSTEARTSAVSGQPLVAVVVSAVVVLSAKSVLLITMSGVSSVVVVAFCAWVRLTLANASSSTATNACVRAMVCVCLGSAQRMEDGGENRGRRRRRGLIHASDVNTKHVKALRCIPDDGLRGGFCVRCGKAG